MLLSCVCLSGLVIIKLAKNTEIRVKENENLLKKKMRMIDVLFINKIFTENAYFMSYKLINVSETLTQFFTYSILNRSSIFYSTLIMCAKFKQ